MGGRAQGEEAGSEEEEWGGEKGGRGEEGRKEEERKRRGREGALQRPSGRAGATGEGKPTHSPSLPCPHCCPSALMEVLCSRGHLWAGTLGLASPR